MVGENKMKIKLVPVSVIAILLLVTTTLAGIQTNTSDDKEINSILTKTYNIEFDNFRINENEKYSVIETGANMNYLMNDSAPMLPYKTELIKLPVGTTIEKVDIITSEIYTFQLDKKVQPSPQTHMDHIDYKSLKTIEGDIYQRDQIYPRDWTSYNIGIGRDSEEIVTMLSIHIYPIRYTPLKNQIQYIENMKIEVSYKLPPSLLFNADAYDLVIIAPSDFATSLLPLVEHKQTNGITTKSDTLNEISAGDHFPVNGRDDQDRGGVLPYNARF